jgi:hypothetical protein
LLHANESLGYLVTFPSLMLLISRNAQSRKCFWGLTQEN